MVNLDTRNTIGVRNVYPGQPGTTTAQRGGAANPASGVSAQGSADAAEAGITGAAGAGVLGKPLSWWVLLVALLVALMYAAQRFGSQGEEFKTIKLSIYNVLVIALAAIVGIGFLKVVFSKWQVPGLSNLILAV